MKQKLNFIDIVPIWAIFIEMEASIGCGLFLTCRRIDGISISLITFLYSFYYIHKHYKQLNDNYVFKDRKGKIIKIKNTSISRKIYHVILFMIGLLTGWSIILCKYNIIYSAVFLIFLSFQLGCIYYIYLNHIMCLDHFTIEEAQNGLKK